MLCARYMLSESSIVASRLKKGSGPSVCPPGRAFAAQVYSDVLCASGSGFRGAPFLLHTKKLAEFI